MSNHLGRNPNDLRPMLRLSLGVALGVFLLLPIVFQIATTWPPMSIERGRQRKEILQRVQAAGGWEALRRDCEMLVEQHKQEAFFWGRADTNELPVAIAALRPMRLTVGSPRVLLEGVEVPVARIQVFGSYRIVGHSIPYFWLEIAAGPNAHRYKPKVSGNLITNNIYEVFEL
jgi:hypothetical protein